MSFSERTPSVYTIGKKHKTWRRNTIFSLQGKKSIEEVVLNQIRKGQYLEADTQQICIWTKMFLENWSTIGTNFKERWLHPHLLSLSSRTLLLRGATGGTPSAHHPPTCCCPRSTPQPPAAHPPATASSTGRANSSLLLNKATYLLSNASYSAQYGKRKLGKIEYPKFGSQAAGLPISLSAQLIPTIC